MNEHLQVNENDYKNVINNNNNNYNYNYNQLLNGHNNVANGEQVCCQGLTDPLQFVRDCHYGVGGDMSLLRGFARTVGQTAKCFAVQSKPTVSTIRCISNSAVNAVNSLQMCDFLSPTRNMMCNNGASAFGNVGSAVSLVHVRGFAKKKKKKGKGKAAEEETPAVKDEEPSETEEAGMMFDATSVQQYMDDAIDNMQTGLLRLQAGRTDPKMLDDIEVEAYEAFSTLSAVGQVSVRGNQSLFVSLYDSSLSDAVASAIRSAGMNLNPIPDDNGNLSVPIPKTTQESRNEMVKSAGTIAESTRQRIRRVRKLGMNKLKEAEDISEDELKREQKVLQEISDAITKLVEEALKRKVEDLTTV